MALRGAIVMLALCASACLQASTVTCDDGRVCAGGRVCIDSGGCALPEQLDACVDHVEGEPCEFLGGNGRCTDGVCIGVDCGNGDVDDGEVCDDGNTESGDGCRNDCTKLELCGDGAVDAGEGCDDGAGNADTLEATCRTDCTLPHCGDGVVVASAGEACEPGAALVLDCTDFGYYVADGLVCGALCQFDTSACVEECGDGVPNGEEICDGTPPPGMCVDYGFDAGPLQCASCAPAFGDCHFIGWKPFLGEQGARAVFGWPDDVYAIQSDVLAHFDGHTWSPMRTLPTPVYSPAKIWGSGPDDLYAGAVGFLIHFDGAAWTTLFTTGNYTMWGSGPDDVWVVGDDDNLVRHFDGATWSTANANAPRPIEDVWASGPDDAFVVGDGFVSHWDGGAWTVTDLKPRWLTRIWGSGPDDVFAAGASGALVHFDGTSWRDMLTGSGRTFYAIAGTGPDDVYAAGTGMLLHYDGADWRSMDLGEGAGCVWPLSPSSVFASGLSEYRGAAWTEVSIGWAGAELRAVAPAGPDEMFAVGHSGTIVRHDGRAWSLEASGTFEELTGAWASSPTDRFAVGWNGTILHDDGTGWTRVSSGSTANFFNVWGSGPDDVYVTGGNTLRHFDGTTWAPVAALEGRTVVGVWGRSSTDVYVVGAGDVHHYDGTSWTTTTLSTGNLYDVSGSGATDVYVAGSEGVWWFDGTTWWPYTDEPYSPDQVTGTGPGDLWVMAGQVAYHWHYGAWEAHPELTARSVLALPGETVAVGESTSIERAVGVYGFVREYGTWSATDYLVPQYTDLWAVAEDAVYAVVPYSTSQTLARYDGHAWSAVTTRELTGLQSASAIWGAAPDALFVVTNGAPGVYRFDGTTLTPQTVPGGSFVDVWGSSASDVFVVGAGIVHYDGASWQTVDATGGLHGVWGSGPTDVYAVGDGGTIVHYDGTSWSAQASGVTEHLRAVWGSGPGDVFAVGGLGIVLHHDGTSWSRLEAGTTAPVLAISGTGPGDVFLTTTLGILHYDGARFAAVRSPPTGGVSAVAAAGDSVFFAGTERGITRLVRTSPW